MKTVCCRFVKFIPDNLEEGILYISKEFKTAIHLCACGCGNQVVTPFSPTDWKILYNNDTVSLYPSIGNWSFKCKSHYWIKNSQIFWSKPFSDYAISRVRDFERKEIENYFKKRKWRGIKEKLKTIFTFLKEL